MQAKQAEQPVAQGCVTKRFSDFAAEQGPLEGKKLALDSILNTEVLFTGYRSRESKYKGNGKPKICLTVQLVLDQEPRIFFTGSEVLASQFEKYEQELPFWATIKKIDKYFTLA